MKTAIFYLLISTLLVQKPQIDHLSIVDIGETDNSADDINLYNKRSDIKPGSFDYILNSPDYTAIENLLRTFKDYSKSPSTKNGSFAVTIYKHGTVKRYFLTWHQATILFHDLLVYLYKHPDNDDLKYQLNENLKGYFI